MKKKIVFLGLILLSCFLMAGCEKKVSNESISVTAEQESAAADSMKETKDINDTEESEEKNHSTTMSIYTEAPNQNSSVKIQYPEFVDNDALNTLVYEKVQSLARIDTSLFSGDASLNMNYQSAVTLKNNKAVSIIFWGESSMEDEADPSSDLIALNIDLLTMKEITLKDLYTINADFETVFFDKSFFPENPVTSYDKDSFPEMLKLQSPEYQTVDPFLIEGNVSFFLKPDGIVLSMPASHATGSDHFEAQLKYSDIQSFYLPKQNYWEDQS